MKKIRKDNKISVLGAGLWGTVLANHLARQGHEVSLWEFFPELARGLDQSRKHPHIPHLELDAAVRVTSDIGASVRGARIVLVAVPSAFVRQTVRNLRGLLEQEPKKPLLVTASKGVEPKTLQTMAGRVWALSGPSFAREVARGVATKVLIAGPLNGSARELQAAFSGGPLRVELSRDRRGVELGGSLKNVLAIACGILDGMQAGQNTKAALLTQGMSEMARLIQARGGRRETVYGLAGLGDMILTGTSTESRNRTLGEKLGAGKTLQAAMREIPTVMEGVESAKSAYALAKKSRVDAPVLCSIWEVLHRDAPSRRILQALGFD